MTLRIILKNGAEFTVKAADLEYAWNDITGELTRLNFKGVTENKPVHLALDQVVAIVRGLSDEIEEAEAETKPKTNRDTLRTMTSEELARFIRDVADCCETEDKESCKRCPLYAADDCYYEGITAWLEKEVEGNGA